MNIRWGQTGSLPPGGLVFSVAAHPKDARRTWVATAAGIMATTDKGWHPARYGLALNLPQTLLATETLLFAGGQPYGIARSADGWTWGMAWLEKAEEPVSYIIASPDFENDGVLLAATHGGGILRSMDRGLHWRLSNFGLRDFDIITLAVPPAWQDKQQFVFAGGATGVYVSVDGGRAWKRSGSGLEGTSVQSLAISPNFTTDHTIYAGTEGAGLFVSQDSGSSWQKVEINLLASAEEQAEIQPLEIVNVITYIGPGSLLIGDGSGGFLRSEDDGKSWTPLSTELSPVLSIAVAADGTIWAGTTDSGLWSSQDQGTTWQADEKLVARGIDRMHPISPTEAFLTGPTEGIWMGSMVHHAEWHSLLQPLSEGPMLAFLAIPSQNTLFAALSTGLFRSARPSEWHLAHAWTEEDGPGTSLCSGSDDRIWMGTDKGKVLVSRDGGETWNPTGTPFSGESVIALEYKASIGLVAATFDPRQEIVRFWRQGTGGRWEQITQARTIIPRTILCLGETIEESLFATGDLCLRYAGTGWQSNYFRSDEPLVYGMVRLPYDKPLYLAATSIGLVYSRDARLWRAVSGNGEEEVILDLYAPRQGQVFGLVLGGRILEGQIIALAER
ncbi:MAG: hypothetical protein HY326_08345 [Chloroflexi bacterium]|nr:hypothetical protein [Chloroflexota bacterium]